MEMPLSTSLIKQLIVEAKDEYFTDKMRNDLIIYAIDLYSISVKKEASKYNNKSYINKQYYEDLLVLFKDNRSLDNEIIDTINIKLALLKSYIDNCKLNRRSRRAVKRKIDEFRDKYLNIIPLDENKSLQEYNYVIVERVHHQNSEIIEIQGTNRVFQSFTDEDHKKVIHIFIKKENNEENYIFDVYISSNNEITNL